MQSPRLLFGLKILTELNGLSLFTPSVNNMDATASSSERELTRPQEVT